MHIKTDMGVQDEAEDGGCAPKRQSNDVAHEQRGNPLDQMGLYGAWVHKY